MTIEHTPGPWYVQVPFGLDVWSHQGKIAESPSGEISQIEVNMRLIAAAPDMLEALELFIQYHEDPNPGVEQHIWAAEAAYAAIAKARGEA